MQACLAVKDSLSQMSARLEELALQFEPAIEAPQELRNIARQVDQFNRRPLEPLSFQLMHIDHLSDMLDNADNAVGMWSAVTQTLSDYFVSQYYNNMDPLIYDNYLEIEPELIRMAHECHTFITTQDNNNPDEVFIIRQDLMKQVDTLASMLRIIRSREKEPEKSKAFGLANFIQLRDHVKRIPNDDHAAALIWTLVDDFISIFNKACYGIDTLEGQIESEGAMESFAELYRICAYIWPDEDISDDLAKDAYEYSVRKLNELVEYHTKMKNLWVAAGRTTL